MSLTVLKGNKNQTVYFKTRHSKLKNTKKRNIWNSCSSFKDALNVIHCLIYNVHFSNLQS